MTDGSKLQSGIAYEKLRRDIVLGILAPGVRLSEQVIMERYRFKRSAARAALMRLRHEGLVHGSPRSACRVSVLSKREMEEISEMRCLLEPQAARLAAQRRTRSQLSAVDAAASGRGGSAGIAAL